MFISQPAFRNDVWFRKMSIRSAVNRNEHAVFRKNQEIATAASESIVARSAAQSQDWEV